MKYAIGIIVMCVTVFALIPRLAYAGNASVYGTIETSTGGSSGCNRVVKKVKVDAYDEDYGLDDHLGTDYTYLNGLFQVAYVQYENSDVYINVTYKFEATDSHYILVRNEGSNETIVEEKVGGVWADLPDGNTNLGTLNLASNKANIGSEARDCLNWVKDHCADWTMPNDLIARAELVDDPDTGSFCSGDGIFIEIPDYDNPTLNGGAFSDIHHETGHFVQYNAYGNHWPDGDGAYQAEHRPEWQTTEHTALLEGWAEYVAYLTASLDWKNRFPANGSEATWWRGQRPCPPSATPANTGSDNAGDIVEGALWRIWADIGDFSGTLKVFIGDKPDHVQDWLMGYGSDKSWNIETAWNIFDDNGIVYTRACITTFPEGAPPNDAPAGAGNEKAISNITFLRGTVKPSIQQNSTSQLNLTISAQMISADKKRLGYKAAAAGLAETMTVGNWTFLSEVDWGNDIPFDTTDVADGDYDLVSRSRNNREHWDSFDPDFAGDSTASRNSDEKWLKHLQTWYNQDNDPTNDNEGKVIIDNTAPTISNTRP